MGGRFCRDRQENMTDIGTETWLEVQKSSDRVFSKFFYVLRNINSTFAIRHAFLTSEKMISRQDRNKMDRTFELQHFFTFLSCHSFLLSLRLQKEKKKSCLRYLDFIFRELRERFGSIIRLNYYTSWN